MKSKFLLFLFFSLFLTACLNYKQITSLKTDGSGKMFIHYWTDLKADIDSVVSKEDLLFDEEKIKQDFISEYLVINKIEVFKDYSDSTIHAQIEFSFDSIDSLNNIERFSRVNFSLKDGPDEYKIFSQEVMPFVSGFGLANEKTTLTYVYYLPGRIISHNADEISKNMLTWIFKSDEISNREILEATYSPFRLKETPKWIYILAGIVLLIVLIFLFKRKNS